MDLTTLKISGLIADSTYLSASLNSLILFGVSVQKQYRAAIG